jgi:hypothetical protein
MPNEAPLTERAAAEVVELHHFFVRWLDAVHPDPALTLDRFISVAAPEFRLIQPTGAVSDRRSVIDWISRSRASRGTPEAPFVITAEEVEAREVAPGVCLVTYIERQDGPAGPTAWRSSALLCEAAGTPHGLAWLHVQETRIEEGHEAASG